MFYKTRWRISGAVLILQSVCLDVQKVGKTLNRMVTNRFQ